MPWTLIGVGHYCLPGLRVPNAGRTIIAGGHHILTVGRQDRSAHNVCMALETPEFLSTGSIPEPGCGICTRSKHHIAIRREHSTADIAGMTSKGDQQLTSPYIPNSSSSIQACSNHSLAVRRKGSLLDKPTVPGELHSTRK